jgi:hypothetical protein
MRRPRTKRMARNARIAASLHSTRRSRLRLSVTRHNRIGRAQTHARSVPALSSRRQANKSEGSCHSERFFEKSVNLSTYKLLSRYLTTMKQHKVTVATFETGPADVTVREIGSSQAFGRHCNSIRLRLRQLTQRGWAKPIMMITRVRARSVGAARRTIPIASLRCVTTARPRLWRLAAQSDGADGGEKRGVGRRHQHLYQSRDGLRDPKRGGL